MVLPLDNFQVLRSDQISDCEYDLLINFINDGKTWKSITKLWNESASSSDGRRNVFELKNNMNKRTLLIQPKIADIGNGYMATNNIDEHLNILSDTRVLVNCGSYTNLRNLEQLIRWLMIITYDDQPIYIYGKNIKTCNKALFNVRTFYLHPEKYSNKWDTFVTTLENTLRIETKIRELYGHTNVRQIIKKMIGNDVVFTGYQYVNHLFRELKNNEQIDDIIDIIERLQSFCRMYRNIVPFHFKNGVTYQCDYNIEDGIGKFVIIEINNNDCSTPVMDFIYDHKNNHLDDIFLTAMCADLLRPTKCTTFRLVGEVPEVLIMSLSYRSYTVKKLEDNIIVTRLKKKKKRKLQECSD